MKCGTITALKREADKAMIRAAQTRPGGALRDGDELFHAALSDSYSLVRLLTPAALDRESAEMQHCLGNGGYDDLLYRNCYLSLRDPAGKAHATIEIEEWDRISQISGQQNAAPIPKYLDMIMDWSERERWYIVPYATSDVRYYETPKGKNRYVALSSQGFVATHLRDLSPGRMFLGKIEKVYPFRTGIRGIMEQVPQTCRSVSHECPCRANPTVFRKL